MNRPNADGLWQIEKHKGTPLHIQMDALVDLAKQEVWLPTSDHPYHLDDLSGEQYWWTRK